MPDKKVTDLDLIDAIQPSDLIMVIDDPAGTPINKKATPSQLVLAESQITNLVADLAAKAPVASPVFTGFIGGPQQPQTVVINSVDVPLANATVTALTFDTELFDIGNSWTSASPSALFVPAGAGGIYLLFGTCAYQNNGTGGRMARLRINGVGAEATVFVNPFVGDITQLQVMSVARLNPGDYVQLLMYQASGITLNALANSCNRYVKPVTASGDPMALTIVARTGSQSPARSPIAITLAALPAAGTLVIQLAGQKDTAGMTFDLQRQPRQPYSQAPHRRISTNGYAITTYVCPRRRRERAVCDHITGTGTDCCFEGSVVEVGGLAGGTLAVDQAISAAPATADTLVTVQTTGGSITGERLIAAQFARYLSTASIAVQVVSPPFVQEHEELDGTWLAQIAGESDTRIVTLGGTVAIAQWTMATSGNYVAGLVAFKQVPPADQAVSATTIAIGSVARSPQVRFGSYLLLQTAARSCSRTASARSSWNSPPSPASMSPPRPAPRPRSSLSRPSRSRRRLSLPPPSPAVRCCGCRPSCPARSPSPARPWSRPRSSPRRPSCRRRSPSSAARSPRPHRPSRRASCPARSRSPAARARPPQRSSHRQSRPVRSPSPHRRSRPPRCSSRRR